MVKQKLVIVGNGMSGVRTIEEILKLNPHRFDITVFGTEPQVNYNRVLLSSVLQRKARLEDLPLNDRQWYEQNQIKLFTGETVTTIHPNTKQITTDKGRTTSYDTLILATGSSPFLPSIPGIQKPGVFTLRTTEDAKHILHFAKTAKRAVVIGGGILGLEAAKGLTDHGLAVTVVHLGKHLMDRQLDLTAATLLENELSKQGMDFRFKTQTQSIEGDTKVTHIRTTDNLQIPAELVLMSVGVRPNIQLAKEAGIATNRAIIVTDWMQTSCPDIYAVGECAEHRGQVYGLVAPAYEQATILAHHLCGKQPNGYEGTVLATELKLPGVNLYAIGQTEPDPKTLVTEIKDERLGIYKKLLSRNDKLVGAILYGDTTEHIQVKDLLVKKKNVDAERIALFPATSGDALVRTLDPTALVCQCNGVTKAAIMAAVHHQGCESIDEVKKCTKASSSCGGCRGLVEQLLSYSHSVDSAPVPHLEPSICGCTDKTDAEVVQAIRNHALTTGDEVRFHLVWERAAGCSTCNTAIRYYLSVANPKRNVPVMNGVTVLTEERLMCECQPDTSLASYVSPHTLHLSAPTKVRLATASCEHQAGDAMTKDFAAVKSLQGWELYVGGLSNRQVQAGKLWAVTESMSDAAEYLLGLISYYRETAWYGESVSNWLERLHLVQIREVLFDEEIRQELVTRMSQAIECGKDSEEITSQ